MNKTTKSPFSILNLTVNTIISNPVILLPIFILAGIQLFFLEIIFFAPRQPLSIIFGPVIIKTLNPLFMHYPYNYLLLFKWYYGIETFIYIFVNCIFYAAVIKIIELIDARNEVDLKNVFKLVFRAYIHLVTTMILAVLLLNCLSFCFEAIVNRAAIIRSTTGVYYLIKKIIILSSPFIHFLLSSVTLSVFAFILPIIVIEGKNVFTAFTLNFIKLRGLLLLIMEVCVITSMIYLPFLLYRLYLSDKWALTYPEISGLILILSIITMLIVDVIQLTAITLCYLSKTDDPS